MKSLSDAQTLRRRLSSDLTNKISKPVKVIFDTDMYGDIDDGLALVMLHALQDRGEIELLAVTICTKTKWAAPYVDLINTFYGRKNIPIGTIRGGVTEDALNKSQYGRYLPSPNGINYTQYISNLHRNDGKPVYPHKKFDATRHNESVTLMRKTLENQPDNSVVIIGAGYSTNLARLLDSTQDIASKLDGQTLVKKKVKFLSIMAGNFTEIKWGGKKAPSWITRIQYITGCFCGSKRIFTMAYSDHIQRQRNRFANAVPANCD